MKVEGLRETMRKLNSIDRVLTKELRAELKGVADIVAREAQSEMPEVSGRAKSSVRAGADARGPYVAGGKKRVPYFAWLDFGGVLRPTGGRRNTITRDFRRRGRYLYPAIDKHRDELERRSIEAFEKTKRSLDL